MTAFRLLTFGSILAVFGLIVFGGIVRITGSGMGCGPDWPLCNGEAVPGSWSMETTLEYLHRVFALLVVGFTITLLVAGWRRRHQSRWYLRLPMIAAGVVFLQSGLGAVTVLLDLHAEVTTAHLGIAQILLGTLVILGVLIFAHPAGHSECPGSDGSRVTRAGVVAGVATFALLLAGAYTATTGSSYACPEWPLCGGYYVPGAGSVYVDIHLTHRWLALVTALTVGYLIYTVFRFRGDSGWLRRASLGLGGLLLLQIMVGAANIWTQVDEVFAALHLALATLIWALLIATVAVNQKTSPRTITPSRESLWIRRTETAVQTEIGD